MLPSKNLSITLFISISIALLFFVFGTPAQWNLKPERFQTKTETIEKPEYQVTNLISKKFNSAGKLHSKLYADQLDFFNASKLSKLHQPKFDLFTNTQTEHDENTHWEISSLEANSIIPNDLITLTGDIEVKKAASHNQSELKIYSQYMLMDLQTNTITSSQLVTIISEGNKIEGKEFTAELDQSFLRLETEVQSHYQRGLDSQEKHDPNEESDIVYIHAQRFTLEANKNTATYEGSVKLKQGQVTIDADKIVLVKRGAEQIVYAYGNPAYLKQKSRQKQDIDAQAMRFEYNNIDKKVKMFDHARLKQGKAIFEGAYIFYDTQTESVGAEAKEDTRVKMVLPSKTSSTAKPQTEKQTTLQQGKSSQ